MSQARTLFINKSCAWPEMSASTSPSGLHSAAMTPPLMAPTCSHYTAEDTHAARGCLPNIKMCDMLVEAASS